MQRRRKQSSGLTFMPELRKIPAAAHPDARRELLESR